MIYFSLTDIGQRCEKNEDSFFANIKEYNGVPVGLFIIADGLGGYNYGEYASAKCVEVVKDIIDEHMYNMDFDSLEDDYVKSIICNSIKIANDVIFENPNKTLMGTTLVCALIINEKLYVANVGDSRAYMMSENNLVQITKDNSYVQHLLDEGFIDEKEARTHKDRNKITRAVGFEEQVEVDFYVREVQKDDKILLCSDGLTTMVEDEVIKNMLKNSKPKDICEELVRLANDNGGRDNITVISIII